MTTLATALGARWPGQESPIVVEVDPAGGDLMARFRLRDTPGLVSLAAATRRRGGTDPNLVAQHTQLLPGGLRVVLGPVGAEQARAALGVLASGPSSPLRRAADQPGSTVIADCGRVDPDSPVLAIIRSADVMLLVARPHDDELAHVALKLQTAQQWSRRPCFVLVGDGYPTAEVSQTLRIPVMARVPRDIKGAAALCGQSISGRAPSRSALGRAAAKIALNVHVTSQQPIHNGTYASHLRPARPEEVALSVAPQSLAPSSGNGVVAP
ncbi:chromosome partitioning protein [Lentzea albidocapillata]|uniref:chromosome partitioning protein n=1 Tax=Lentzea albidocapillata TaxID=40571 RepID=UPI00115FC3D4|nr:chromosome partitioning protein [Lentzea albidocapillata]